MSQAITKIKSRISSINGAYKVTSAMKLISSVKLKTWRYKMLANKSYADRIHALAEELFSYATNISSPLLETHPEKKRLYIIVSSSLGLCGAYNNNIFNLANVSLHKDDDLILLGKKAILHYSDNSYHSIGEFGEYKSVKDNDIIKQLNNYIIEQYRKGNYSSIHLIYTSYKNPIAFVAKNITLLPLAMNHNHLYQGYPPLLEPNIEILFNDMANMYLETIIYSRLLEAEVCEQASRNNAMENATNNAEELLDKLKIEFAKARQGAITQEITEIVGAANAL